MATGTSNNIPQNKASLPSKTLKGRTGYVVKVISNEEAVLRDNIYGDVLFTKDVVKFPIKDKKSGFTLAFPKNRVVYYDLEIDSTRKPKCTCIWIGKKDELMIYTPVQVDYSLEPKLREYEVYKTTVKRIKHPHAFIAEENISKIPIFVFNQAFMPKRHLPKLKREEPVISYVEKGSTVYVKVRHTPDKEFEWCAWDAWMEDDEDSKANSTSDVNKASAVRRQKDISSSSLHGIDKTPLTGKLCLVYAKTALLESKSSDVAIFHRDNTFLFGVPLRGIQLNKIFSRGDKVNFTLSDELLGEASRVWVGSCCNNSDDVEEKQKRIFGLIKYCKDKGVDAGIQKILLQVAGKQQETQKVNEISEVNGTPNDETNKIQGQQLNKSSSCSLEAAAENASTNLTALVSAPEMTTNEKTVQLNNLVATDIDSKEDGDATVHKTNELADMNNSLPTDNHHTDCIQLSTKKDLQICEYSDTAIVSSSEKDVSTEDTACASGSKQEFGALLINDTVIHCLRRSLLQLLNKEFGEDASENLGKDAMNFFKKNLEQYVLQKLMKKTLSSVIEKYSDKYESEVKESSLESHSQSVVSNGQKNKVNRMVEHWRKSTKQMLEEEKARKLNNKLHSIFKRAKDYQEKLNSTFSNAKLDDSEIDECSDESSNDFDGNDDGGDSFEKRDNGQGNRVVNLVQDFLKIQSNDFFQSVMQNEKNECTDNGTQTTSTGHILFFKYLTDL